MMGPQPVEDENFCLRWNDYEKKYAETFRTLREDEHFADVTLACEGHAVKAHRIILCACSGYFGHILRTINPAQHPVLLLSDVRPNDLTALMDFIYFGQVNITQDSLQSFLKVADKLKIKGLCERALIQPEPPLHQTVAITLPIKEEKKPILPHQGFETLLGRTGQFMPESQQVVSMPQQTLPTLRHSVASSAAPPAHQSPKHTPSRGTTRPPEQQYMIISSPKKAKYSLGSQHASILRNQLVTKDMAGNNVEVKSEPLSMIGTQHHEEPVPSSVASVSVTEFITSEGDLSLPPLPHGMSSQFMFPPDPSPGDPGAIAPQPAALVTIQPEKEAVTSVANYNTTRVVSVSVDHNVTHPSPTTPTHCREDQEPQDLTPMQDVTAGPLSNSQISSHSSPDTPGKKERNSRKQCPYCPKDFHEMSLKRHIKDVHFRTQNTYVICPQCCKQYASQNSLYSHLNRVHGVKKDEIQLQMAAGVMDRGDSNHSDAKYDAGGMMVEGGREQGHDGLLSIRQHQQGGGQQNHDMIVRHETHEQGGIIVRHGQQDGQSIIVRHSQQDSNHEGIMDLAQHSDHSN